MLNNPSSRKRNICDGDDELRVADAVLAAAVRHVVDPLSGVLLVDEPLVLARIPVVASRIGILTTVDTTDDPPVTSYLEIIADKVSLYNRNCLVGTPMYRLY